MRSAGVYLLEAEIGAIRNAAVPAGEIQIALRVGRSCANATVQSPLAGSELQVGAVVQLNVDSAALETQRCSISFTGPQKRIVGIALISLPKDKTFLQNTYRLTQNDDKRAEVEVKVRIAAAEVAARGEGKAESASEGARVQGSSVRLQSNNPENAGSKSKISQEFSCSSEDRKTPKSFKVREEDRVVQTTESELKRIREEKEAYYQLYQIEKAKNEVAARFIAALIRKAADAHPSLLSALSDDTRRTEPPSDKRGRAAQGGQEAAQLEQANRSLHRQVEEYKRLVEQLRAELAHGPVAPRGDIPLHSKASNTFLLPGIFDQPAKSALQQRSNIKSNLLPPSALTSRQAEEKRMPTSEIDFRKWLQQSIGQREEIQGLLAALGERPEGQDRGEKALKRLKASLDKSFAALLSRKELTRDALMSHRKEVNRCFEEVLA